MVLEKKGKVGCAICESKDLIIFATKSKFDADIPTLICKNCGLVFTNSKMTQEEQNQFYKDDTYIKLKYPTVKKYYQEKVDAQTLRAQQSFSFTDQFIKRNSDILDIGCGFATFACLMQKKGKNSNVISTGAIQSTD